MFRLLVAAVVLLVSMTNGDTTTRSLVFGKTGNDFITFRMDNSNIKYKSCICAWVKHSSFDQDQTLWSYDNDGSGYTHLAHQHSYIMLDTTFNGGKIKNLFEGLPLNTWYHICYNWLYNRNYKVYINGKLVATSSHSRGYTRGPGKAMIGNYHSPSISYAFGSELTNFNIFSRELTEIEVQRQYNGGPCYIDPATDGVRTLKWESILGYTRTGNVQEKDIITDHSPACEFQYMKVRLNETTTELNSTKDQLKNTKEQLNSTMVELNSTKSQLSSTTEDLDSTKEELNETKDELNTTEVKLNSTGILYTECSAKLENATEKLKIKPTQWDLLLDEKYLNKILTSESLTSLKNQWELLDNFIGINVTRNIVDHFKDHHRNGTHDDEMGWPWAVLDDFVGIRLTNEVVEHLKDNHLIEPDDSDVN